MNLINLKNQKKTLLNLLQIITSMQNIAKINIQKSNKKKQTLNFGLLKIYPHIHNFEVEKNIIIGCNQGFNGNFINTIKNYIALSNTQFTCIGTRIYGCNLFKTEDDIIQFSKNFLGKNLNNQNMKINLHYCSNEKMKTSSIIINYKLNIDLNIMVLGKFIYQHFLESVLTENKQRLISTEQSKTNIEESLIKTNIEINKMRQSKITNELIENLSGFF